MVRGILLLLVSSVSFALSSLFVKLVTTASDIQAVELTFFRFFAGFIISGIYIVIKGKTVKANNFKYVFMRAFFNTAAVIFFFLGIQYSTVTKSNLLNMSYPVFVFLISPFLNKENIRRDYYVYLFLTMAGLYCIVSPPGGPALSGINRGDLFALASGIIAGLAVTSLRQARKYDSSYLILFYLMGTGTILNLPLTIPVFIIPEGKMLVYTLLCTLAALAGQYTITEGYKYISAAAGSLVSSTRIIFAMVLGITVLAEPITLKIIIGIILILISLMGVSGFWDIVRFKGDKTRGA